MQKLAEEAKYRGYSDQAILASMQAAMQGASWDAALQKGADIAGIDLSSPWTLPYVGSLWDKWVNEQVKNKDLASSSVLSSILKTMNEAVNKAVASGYYSPSEDSEINKAINNLQQKYTEALRKESAAQATKPQNTTSSFGSSSSSSNTPVYTSPVQTTPREESYKQTQTVNWNAVAQAQQSHTGSNNTKPSSSATIAGTANQDAIKKAQQSHTGSNNTKPSSSATISETNSYTSTGNKTGTVGTGSYNGANFTVWVPSNQKKKKNGYADGGVVGGNSFEGDKLLALVNSGESVLTREFTSILPKTVDTMNMFNRLKLDTPDYSFLDKLAIKDSSPTVNISYDNMINIEGNATDDTVQTIKKMMPQITNDITKSLVKDLKKNGFK